MFSPYYAWARRRGPAAAENHCALNVALYGPRAGRWAMTERGASQVGRDEATLSIGPSALRWTGDALEIGVDELCAPLPRLLRGSVRVTPSSLGARSHVLDAAGRHRWTPFAPRARVDVHFTDPAIRWSGIGYLDSNAGEEPLEDAFERWTWSRASPDDGTVVLYDVTPRAGEPRSLALRFEPDGAVEALEAPPAAELPVTGWRLARSSRVDPGREVRVVRTLEDAPFYSRSQLQTHLYGAAAPAVHESLDLNRFRSRWVQCLLPFRMPRRFF